MPLRPRNVLKRALAVDRVEVAPQQKRRRPAIDVLHVRIIKPAEQEAKVEGHSGNSRVVRHRIMAAPVAPEQDRFSIIHGERRVVTFHGNRLAPQGVGAAAFYQRQPDVHLKFRVAVVRVAVGPSSRIRRRRVAAEARLALEDEAILT